MNTLKKKSYPANTPNRVRSRMDKKRIGKSPNLEAKKSAYIKPMRMTVFASTDDKLKHIVTRMSNQYNFEMDQVEFSK